MSRHGCQRPRENYQSRAKVLFGRVYPGQHIRNIPKALVRGLGVENNNLKKEVYSLIHHAIKSVQ